jgi:hypothetical protein
LQCPPTQEINIHSQSSMLNMYESFYGLDLTKLSRIQKCLWPLQWIKQISKVALLLLYLLFFWKKLVLCCFILYNVFKIIFMAYIYLLFHIKLKIAGKAHFTMKWQSFFFPIFNSNFFLGFEDNNFETIRFPQQVLAYFYLLISQFAPFQKITN